MVALFQKRVGHEPERWEDLSIPGIGSSDAVSELAQHMTQLKAEGTYRVIADTAKGSNQIHVFDVYRKEVFECRIDGVVQS